MAKQSAGLLLYRRLPQLEVLLAHPGGPFFASKDDGVWTIPKGEIDPDEDPLACAKRELEEEIGIAVGARACVSLGSIKQKGGKVVSAWACECDWDGVLRSNDFELEWPPRSGRTQTFPEVDRAAFFSIEVARTKLNPAQVAFLDRLIQAVA